MSESWRWLCGGGVIGGNYEMNNQLSIGGVA